VVAPLHFGDAFWPQTASDDAERSQVSHGNCEQSLRVDYTDIKETDPYDTVSGDALICADMCTCHVRYVFIAAAATRCFR